MARVGESGIAGEETEDKWLKHYASFHRILLVAEGDFSFSLSLAMAFGSATNILASSLDSYGRTPSLSLSLIDFLLQIRAY